MQDTIKVHVVKYRVGAAKKGPARLCPLRSPADPRASCPYATTTIVTIKENQWQASRSTRMATQRFSSPDFERDEGILNHAHERAAASREQAPATAHGADSGYPITTAFVDLVLNSMRNLVVQMRMKRPHTGAF